MCQNNGIIISIFILKIFALLIIPGILLYFRLRHFENYNRIIYAEIIILVLLIIIGIIKSDCIINSSIFRIERISMNEKNDFEIVKESNDVTTVKKVQSTDKYKTANNKKVYYYNNYNLPLSDKKVSCNGKNVYFKNIGNNITALSMLLSTELNADIDPLQILRMSIEKEIVDCDSGISFMDLLNLISSEYNVSFRSISKEEAEYYVANNKVVLAGINNNNLTTNISCENSYIILYQLTNDGKYNILNPNDREYDYICPDNTKGYGTIIKSHSNEKAWGVDDIDDIATNYIIIER